MGQDAERRVVRENFIREVHYQINSSLTSGGTAGGALLKWCCTVVYFLPFLPHKQDGIPELFLSVGPML